MQNFQSVTEFASMLSLLKIQNSVEFYFLKTMDKKNWNRNKKIEFLKCCYGCIPTAHDFIMLDVY